VAIEKLKRCKLPGIDQILAEQNKAGSRKIRTEAHYLINPIRNKEEVPQPWRKSIILPIHRKEDKQIVVIIDPYYSYKLHIKINQQPFVKVNSVRRGKHWRLSVWILT